MTTTAVWRHRLAVVGCGLWLAAMVWMSLTMANPPVVSRPQVLSAVAVVRGVLTLAGEPRVKVEEVLWSKRPLKAADFAVGGLPVAAPKGRWATNGAAVIVPLEETVPGMFRVQQIPFEMKPPDEADRAPIYPATPLVAAQLEKLRPKAAN